MPIDLVWHDKRPTYEERHAGAAFFIEAANYESALSDKFIATDAEHRQPIMVMIPYRGRDDGWCFPFIIDSHPSAEPEAHWDVTVDLSTLVDGQKPDITVNPSIKAHTMFHGWLVHGVLSDDIGD